MKIHQVLRYREYYAIVFNVISFNSLSAKKRPRFRFDECTQYVLGDFEVFVHALFIYFLHGSLETCNQKDGDEKYGLFHCFAFFNSVKNY